MRRDDLPRPAFLRDLDAIAARSGVDTVLVLVETPHEAQAEAIGMWKRAFPGRRLVVAAPDTAIPALEAAFPRRGPDLEFAAVTNWVGAEMTEAVVQRLAELGGKLIVSTMPYDAYGTLVKRPIESGVLQVLQRTGALYLVHDPVFGTIRALDAELVRDRLVWRGARRWICRAVARAVIAIATVASMMRRRRLGWRPES